MSTEKPPRAVYRFDRFTLDLAGGALLANGDTEVSLRPKSFALLRLFVENAGHLLDRDAIMAAVWPEVFVTEDSITQCVRDVRRALGDETGRLLRTVPRRGYLLTAEVSLGGPAKVVPQEPSRLSAGRPAMILSSGGETSEAEPIGMDSALRAGTLAFLFTDIEGSTALWERAPWAMREALARHDTLLRAVISGVGGHVFKTMGDAVHAAFPDAPTAIAAALAVQRALEADGFPETDGLKVRMAVHAGAVEARHGDYFGQPLNRVARLLATGYGGQVLVSGVVAALAQGSLPPEASLRDLGRHQLKDLAQPEQVYQLVAPGLPAGFPPLHSLTLSPNNLPQQITTFVDRAVELAEIKARLERHRLVTLVGSGGVGKTRLALQVAADLSEHYPDGVWLVELAPLADPQLVAETIAGLFGLARSTGRSGVEIVVAFLKDKRTLLLFDNCEHLVATAARVADAILRGCPTVSVLATSREGLAIAGESTYRVPSLGFPEHAKGVTAKAALGYAAVRLFADRAGGGFAVTDENAPVVAAICHRLDGVALAIELAAPRLRMLKPQELASRLDDRFRVLTGGSRTALPRQRTLRAMIDWSYDLLTDSERTLLRRLSVFAGGWTLDSAAAVGAGDPIDEADIFDLLSSLVDKSLVVADTAGKETRYRLLESTRQYGLEKLAGSGECGRRRWLAEHLVALCSRAEASWPTAATEAWLHSYVPELDNLRAALEWAYGPGGDEAIGLDLTGRSLPLFLELSLLPEQKRWFDAAIERIGNGTPPATAARLWLGSSFTHRMYYRNPLGAEAASRAAAFYREASDALGLGAALVRAGAALLTPGDTAAGERLLHEAEELLRPLGRTKYLAACLNAMSVARNFANDNPASRAALTEAAAISRVLGDRHGLLVTLTNLAELEFESGAVELAAGLAQEVVAEALAANDRWALAATQVNQANYLAILGSPVEAQAAAKAGLRMARSLGLAEWIMGGIETLALLAAGGGQGERAARLLGYGTAAYAALGAKRLATESAIHDRLCAALAETLPAGLRERLMAEGAAWTETQAVDEALVV